MSHAESLLLILGYAIWPVCVKLLSVSQPVEMLAAFPLLKTPAVLERAIPWKGGIILMRNYELMFILHPDLDEANVETNVERVKSWITESGGSIIKQELWGKRRLAYKIRKQAEGIYVLLQASLEPAFTSEMERNLRLTEQIMRFLLTAMDE